MFARNYREIGAQGFQIYGDCMYTNVTLVVEMKDKEFTSHKAKYSLQFGTNNNMIGLSLTFKSIKQKIQFFQHSEQISFLMF